MRLLFIRVRFFLFFAIILGLLSYATLLAWREMTPVMDLADQMRDGPFLALDAANGAQRNFLLLHRHSLLADKMPRPKWLERYTKHHDRVNDELDRMVSLSKDEGVKTHAQKAGALLRNLDTLIKQGTGSNRGHQIDSLGDAFEVEIDAGVAHARTDAAVALRIVTDGIARSRNVVTAFGVAVGLLWMLAALVVNNILRSFTSASAEAKRIASGDLEQSIAVRSAGEAGQLLSALEVIQRKLREQQTDLEAAAITDRLKMELEHVALTDKLTGLANRRKLEDVWHDLLARKRRSKDVFSVIILDIDKFKSVNDTYGHQVGDEVLKSVAQVLKRELREVDFVGRWGGEEFIVLCPTTSSIGAANVAEKLRAAMESHDFPVVKRKTASFGVAEVAGDETLEQAVTRADAALYRAKENGRNRVELA